MSKEINLTRFNFNEIIKIIETYTSIDKKIEDLINIKALYKIQNVENSKKISPEKINLLEEHFNDEIAFEEKCDIEIERLKSLQRMQNSATKLPAETKDDSNRTVHTKGWTLRGLAIANFFSNKINIKSNNYKTILRKFQFPENHGIMNKLIHKTSDLPQVKSKNDSNRFSASNTTSEKALKHAKEILISINDQDAIADLDTFTKAFIEEAANAKKL